jgi:hypothetical protein
LSKRERLELLKPIPTRSWPPSKKWQILTVIGNPGSRLGVDITQDVLAKITGNRGAVPIKGSSSITALKLVWMEVRKTERIEQEGSDQGVRNLNQAWFCYHRCMGRKTINAQRLFEPEKDIHVYRIFDR